MPHIKIELIVTGIGPVQKISLRDEKKNLEKISRMLQ